MNAIISLLVCLVAALSVSAYPHKGGKQLCIELYEDPGDACIWKGIMHLNGVPNVAQLADIISVPISGSYHVDGSNPTDYDTIYGAITFDQGDDALELSLSMIDPFGTLEIDLDTLEIGQVDQADDGVEQWSHQAALEDNEAGENLCSAKVVECEW